MGILHNLLFLTLILFSCCIISCSESQEQKILDRAEAIMESQPDSALTLLISIDKQRLSGDLQKAQYALLMSMALDKNYIDTTSFEVLQPAIDYYLKKGTPDEKLRTYYYQGRIFQNQDNKDSAINSFINGIDISRNSTDSLCLARTLVAEACLYYDFYDFIGYVNNNLNAATIYHRLSYVEKEFDCLLNAFGGATILEDRDRADSLYSVCNQFGIGTVAQLSLLQSCNLSYITTFGSNQTIREYVENLDINTIASSYSSLNLALALHKIGYDNQAKELLDCTALNDLIFDTLKYQAVTVSVLESMGQYHDALSIYQNFTQKLDSINRWKFDQKSKSVEERHQMELKVQEEARQKSKIIWGCIFGIVILSMGVFILFLLFRSSKTNKELALEKVKVRDAENAALKSEKENLVLENKNLQLERDKKALEADNLVHRVVALENESDRLKTLIDEKNELPLEVRNEIKVRIEMLNSLLASHITANEQYEKPYEAWVREITDNTEKFMNSNRLAFQVSHPRFIQYFEDHGLTIDEINYVCLYAIGLRGKEVGSYIKKRSHVNTSSAIRKKLGIDKHETNIGIYVRKLLKNL